MKPWKLVVLEMSYLSDNFYYGIRRPTQLRNIKKSLMRIYYKGEDQEDIKSIILFIVWKHCNPYNTFEVFIMFGIWWVIKQPCIRTTYSNKHNKRVLTFVHITQKSCFLNLHLQIYQYHMIPYNATNWTRIVSIF